MASKSIGVHMEVTHGSPLIVRETGISTMVSESNGSHFWNS